MKPIYEIRVHRMDPESDTYQQGRLYGLTMNKKIGDSSGYGSSVSNKEALIIGIKHMIEEWKRFDSILGRTVDPPDRKNTEVVVEEGLEKELISPSEIWTVIIQARTGAKDIRAFFS